MKMNREMIDIIEKITKDIKNIKGNIITNFKILIKNRLKILLL